MRRSIRFWLSIICEPTSRWCLYVPCGWFRDWSGFGWVALSWNSHLPLHDTALVRNANLVIFHFFAMNKQEMVLTLSYWPCMQCLLATFMFRTNHSDNLLEFLYGLICSALWRLGIAHVWSKLTNVFVGRIFGYFRRNASDTDTFFISASFSGIVLACHFLCF